MKLSDVWNDEPKTHCDCGAELVDEYQQIIGECETCDRQSWDVLMAELDAELAGMPGPAEAWLTAQGGRA